MQKYRARNYYPLLPPIEKVIESLARCPVGWVYIHSLLLLLSYY